MSTESSLVSRLLLLKPKVRELQGPAVFRHVANQFFGGSVWEFGADFQRDFDELPSAG